VKLLPPDLLIKTGPVDHADWNYRSTVLGAISRSRFSLLRRLLGNLKVNRLLELGYGSGILLPELAQYCDQLYGVDIHRDSDEVSKRLSAIGVDAKLHSADAKDLPFSNGFFECVVAVSVLEFIDDLDEACSEIVRVLSPGGFLVVITPSSSPLLDAGLRLLTGESAKQDFGNRRNKVIPALRRYFFVAERRSVGIAPVTIYTGMRFYLGYAAQARLLEAVA
jgi:ubiquinone/menaquinone biosynthesis C-methylase UbiE